MCVHRRRVVMMPRQWGHTNYTVYVGVLLLRCVSKPSNRPCLFKSVVEVAETSPGQFACDLERVLYRLPPMLEYRGNQQLDIRVIEKQEEEDLPVFRFATGKHRTGRRPQSLQAYNAQELVDPRTSPIILELWSTNQ